MREYEILKQKISRDTDLLEHYIKHLPLMQDWERIMAWEVRGSSASLKYCYGRTGSYEWKRCKPGREHSVANCVSCKIRDEGGYFENLEEWILDADKKHRKTDESFQYNKFK